MISFILAMEHYQYTGNDESLSAVQSILDAGAAFEAGIKLDTACSATRGLRPGLRPWILHT